jgi:hypothetical protein
MWFAETGAPEEIRTPNLLIRSQMLYPIELRARVAVRGRFGLPMLRSAHPERRAVRAVAEPIETLPAWQAFLPGQIAAPGESHCGAPPSTSPEVGGFRAPYAKVRRRKTRPCSIRHGLMQNGHSQRESSLRVVGVPYKMQSSRRSLRGAPVGDMGCSSYDRPHTGKAVDSYKKNCDERTNRMGGRLVPAAVKGF